MGLKRITQDELEVFLKKHKLWLINDPNGKRANLTGANLTGADLYGADLYGADLTRADLTRANLTGANLYGADLYGADLTGADLTRADLTRANLTGADLTRANLIGADLYGADHLDKATNVNLPIACPEKGSFTAFKKACDMDGNYCIVELTIPKDALRCSATSRKCRCSKAKVVSITNLDGTTSKYQIAYANYDHKFTYRVGKTVKVSNFDPDRWHECAPGIHFFITRDEAVNYCL